MKALNLHRGNSSICFCFLKGIYIGLTNIYEGMQSMIPRGTDAIDVP